MLTPARTSSQAPAADSIKLSSRHAWPYFVSFFRSLALAFRIRSFVPAFALRLRHCPDPVHTYLPSTYAYD